MATTTAATATEIQTLYVAYFNRPADPLGLQSWLSTGASVATIAAGFSASAEYTATYGGKSPIDLVDSIYMNLFGRHAEPEGLLYWAGKLQAKTETFASIVLTIANAAQNEDLVAIDSKVAAATAFTESLDTSAEIRGYDGAAANAVVKAWLANVKDEATLGTATTAAALDAIAAASAAAHDGAVNNPQTFTLTKGLDTITGGAGNDVIIGGIDTTTTGTANAELTTLSSLDVINGGAGIDTLKIVSTGADAGTITLGNLSSVEIVTIDSAKNVDINSAAISDITNLNVTRANGVVTATAAATTSVDVSVKDGGDVTVKGGKDVKIALTDAHSDIIVGDTTTSATGVVTVDVTGKAAANNANTLLDTNSALGDITVTGGKTVSVTQHATSSSSAIVADGGKEIVTQGNVIVNASSITTDVTVKQDAQVDAASRAAVAGATEVTSVKFAALKAGETVAVGGLTFKAAQDLTAAQVAQAFANLSSTAVKPTDVTPTTATGDTQGSGVRANGVFTGSLAANWSSAAAAADGTVVFTGKANTDLNDLVATTSGTTAPTVTTTTQGVTAVSAKNTLGIENGTVTIKGGLALKNVTVDGYATSTGTAGITGATNTALDTIKLANGGSFEIDSAAATLSLTADNVDGTVSVAAGTKTINAAVTGADTVTVLASVTAETVNVSGSGNVEGTTGAGAGNLNAVTAINTSGQTAGSTATFIIADGALTTYTGGAGVDTVTVSNANQAITKAINLGAGDDKLILSGTVVVPTATLSGGAGTDIIALNGASAVTLSANGDFAAKIDGFEKLEITDVVTTATTINMANMDGINYVIANSGATTSAPTKATFSVDVAGSAVDANDTITFFAGGALTVTGTPTPAQLALALAGVSYTGWNVKSVSGTVITFEAVTAGTGTAVPTAGAAFTFSDVGATGSTFTQPTSGITAGTVGGATAPALTIDKIANNGTVELAVAGGGVIVKLADASGSADSFNIVTKVAGGDLTFGTVDVAGVETIKYTATDTIPTVSGSASIQAATLNLKADKAATLTIDGNSDVVLTLDTTTTKLVTIDAGALTGKLNVAANGANAMTITGGSAADTLKASVGADAKADIINGGAGNDIIYAGTNGAKLTGGDGNDTFIVSGGLAANSGNKESNTYSEITDFKAGDILQLRAVNVGGTAVADVAAFGKLTAILNEATATFSNFVDAAIKQAGTDATVDGNAAVWFSFKGDTYVVVDNGTHADAFQNGTDSIVKLTGISGDNLSWNATFATAALV